jgi:hypothetical protein
MMFTEARKRQHVLQPYRRTHLSHFTQLCSVAGVVTFTNVTWMRFWAALIAFILIGFGVEALYRQVRATSGPHGYYIVFTRWHGTSRGGQSVSTLLSNDGRYGSLDECNKGLESERRDGLTNESCVKMLDSDAATMRRLPL